MKVKKYRCEYNTGFLKETNEIIEIRSRRFITNDKTSHPLQYSEPIAFENKNVYCLYLFDSKDKENSTCIHISLTFWEKQKFLFLQKKHWIQKEENIRYIINLLFLIGGITLAILNYKK